MNQDINIDQFAKPGAQLGAFERYSNFVRDYASRNLTNSSDVSNAFRGIEEPLKIQFDFKGFLYGLPVVFFSQALLWSSEGYFPDQRLKGFPIGHEWDGKKEGPYQSTLISRYHVERRDAVLWHWPCEGGGFVFIMVDEVRNLANESLSIQLRNF